MTGLIPGSGALRTWVDVLEPLTEAPAEAQLGVAIATISAAIGWKAPLTWGVSSEPCTINTILEAGSATGRKTTTANNARALIHTAVGDIPDDDCGLFAHMVSHTSDRGLLELISPKDDDIARLWEERPPPGNLIVWDEIGGLLGDPGQNRKSGDWQGRIRTTLMQIANGRHGGIKTGAGTRPAGRCAVSIVGTVTRMELEQRIDSGLLRDGFIGRFMLIPNNGRARLLSRPPAWTPQQVDGHKALTAWLRAVSERRTPFCDSIFDLYTPTARDMRDDWYENRTHELDALSGEEHGRAMVEVFGRLQTTQVKLSALAAVSAMPTSQVDTETPKITEAHIEWANHIVEMSLREVASLADFGHPVNDQYRQIVVDYLQNHDGQASRRDLIRGTAFGRIDAAKRWAIIEDMVGNGDVWVAKEQSDGRPRHVVTLAESPYPLPKARHNGNPE